MKDPQIFRQEDSDLSAQGHQLVNTQSMKKEQLASRPGSALALGGGGGHAHIPGKDLQRTQRSSQHGHFWSQAVNASC
jgi:hypothetical protein